MRGLKGPDGLCVATRSRATALPCPSRAQRFTAVRRGRACPARGFAMLPVNGLNPSGHRCRSATSPDGEASPAQKKAPLSKGDSPQCGEMSRSDRGARARRAGRVSGLGDSDGPCLIARYTRRRPGIPPPRLRSAPPFDKGCFLRGRSPQKGAPRGVGDAAPYSVDRKPSGNP